MEKGGANVQRNPKEMQLDHMSAGELSHIHYKTSVFFKLQMYVGE